MSDLCYSVMAGMNSIEPHTQAHNNLAPNHHTIYLLSMACNKQQIASLKSVQLGAAKKIIGYSSKTCNL